MLNDWRWDTPLAAAGLTPTCYLIVEALIHGHGWRFFDITLKSVSFLSFVTPAALLSRSPVSFGCSLAINPWTPAQKRCRRGDGIRGFSRIQDYAFVRFVVTKRRFNREEHEEHEGAMPSHAVGVSDGMCRTMAPPLGGCDENAPAMF